MYHHHLLTLNQDLSCSSCTLSTWGAPSSAAYITQYTLMAKTFQAAIYTSLNLGTLGGNVTVTGFTQKPTRRHLLSPTLTAAYTVRINNPLVKAADVTTTLKTSTLVASLGTAMTAATGTTVAASAPEVSNFSPTASPVKSAAASIHSHTRRAGLCTALVVALTMGALAAVV